MQNKHKIGLGALVLVMGGSPLAMKPHAPASKPASPYAQAHMKLAALSTDSRQDVDYTLLDSRIRQLMTKPAMVGMSVGVV